MGEKIIAHYIRMKDVLLTYISHRKENNKLATYLCTSYISGLKGASFWVF